MLAALAFAQAMSRPNIIVIFSDDHARRAISAYGGDLLKTPGIDGLARAGVRFDRHYTSNPICAPSRATLLTGKFSHANGHKDNVSSFDGSQVTLPKLLKEAGYDTAAIGKWHLQSNPTGFDHWEVLPGQGDYYHPRFITPLGEKVESGYVTDVITAKSLDWIRERKGKPFFLFMGHKAPHRNWVPRIEDLRKFAQKTYPEPKTLQSDLKELASGARQVKMNIERDMRVKEDLLVDYVPPRLKPHEAELWRKERSSDDRAYWQTRTEKGVLRANYQRYMADYLACISAVDQSVAEVRTTLKKLRLDRNTIVVYASDQGFFTGENGWYDKRWFYEPSAGTPFVIAGPGISRRSVSQVTSNVDLAPTLLDLAGIAPAPGMQGRSLVPLLAGKPLAEVPAYGHFYESDDPDHKTPKYVAIATQRYKLIFYYELGEWELFDLVKDPDEQHPLKDPKLMKEMKDRLRQRMIEVGDPIPSAMD